MEIILKSIINSETRRENRIRAFNIFESYKSFKNGFQFGFENKPSFPLLFRFPIGTVFMAVGATVNLYRIRQNIIKYTILLTKSKNPNVIRVVM